MARTFPYAMQPLPAPTQLGPMQAPQPSKLQGLLDSGVLGHIGRGLLAVSGVSNRPRTLGEGFGIGLGLMDKEEEKKAARALAQAKLDMDKRRLGFEQDRINIARGQLGVARDAEQRARDEFEADKTGVGGFEGTSMDAQAANIFIKDQLREYKRQNPNATPADLSAVTQSLAAQLAKRHMLTPKPAGFDTTTGQPRYTLPQPLPGVTALLTPQTTTAPSTLLTPATTTAAPVAAAVNAVSLPPTAEAKAAAASAPARSRASIITSVPLGNTYSEQDVSDLGLEPGLYVRGQYGPKMVAAGDKAKGMFADMAAMVEKLREQGLAIERGEVFGMDRKRNVDAFEDTRRLLIAQIAKTLLGTPGAEPGPKLYEQAEDMIPAVGYWTTEKSFLNRLNNLQREVQRRMGNNNWNPPQTDPKKRAAEYLKNAGG